MPTYVQPIFPTLLVLLVVGLFMARRSCGKKAFFILALAVGLLIILSWPPFCLFMFKPFQDRYRLNNVPLKDAQAIVVLSSGIQYPTVPELPASRIGSDTYERCLYAAWLQKKSGLPLLASGGGNQDDPDTPPYAMLMKEALIKEGVPETMIWSEALSRTTHENAVFAARMLRDKGITRIVLVTDAYHMLRADKSFRKQGLEVVPAACAFRRLDQLNLTTLLPTWEALAFDEDLLHETLGLFWYKLHGWI